MSVHNSDLADVMGNLVHRATNLCSKNCGGAMPSCAVDVVFDVAALRVQTELAIKSFEVRRCCELAINAMKDTNKYLTDSAPWCRRARGGGAKGCHYSFDARGCVRRRALPLAVHPGRHGRHLPS